jgi:hypothetical protein
MKRLILDFEKDGNEYVYKIYHPLQKSINGIVSYTSNPASLVLDLSNKILEHLPKTPKLSLKSQGIFQEDHEWHLVHTSKLQAFEVTINSLNDKIKLLEDKCTVQSA